MMWYLGTAEQRTKFAAMLEPHGYCLGGVLGYGGFGIVYQCTKVDTNEVVALKICYTNGETDFKNEVDILRSLGDLDKENIVRLNTFFVKDKYVFIEYEKLDMSLDDFVRRLDKPLHLSEIQVMTRSLLQALDTLKRAQIVHRDLKLCNLMFINHQQQPFKVKVIDFGRACHVNEMCTGDRVGSLSTRAPEALLGLPMNEAVDMWALAYILITMYMGTFWCLGTQKVSIMAKIVQLFGKPDDHMLNAGLYTNEYFYKDVDSLSSSWKLGTDPEQDVEEIIFEDISGNFHSDQRSCELLMWLSRKAYHRLDGNVMTHRDTCEHKAFVSLLKEMLQVDPAKRITPSEALKHPFMTMTIPSSKEETAKLDVSMSSSEMMESQTAAV